MPEIRRNPGTSARGTSTTTTVANTHRSWSTRRLAALRVPPLGECGCIRDPERDRHRCGSEITNKMIDAAVDAAEHLAALGFPGMFDADICRAIYRRDRDLAVRCFRYSRGEAA